MLDRSDTEGGLGRGGRWPWDCRTGALSVGQCVKMMR